MATFKEWFEEFLKDRKVKIENSNVKKDFDKILAEYKWRMSEEQIEEAEAICKEFLESGEVNFIELGDSLIKLEFLINVNHVAGRGIGLVEGYAKNLISKELLEFVYGCTFEVRVVHDGTFCEGKRISTFVRRFNAVAHYKITLELEMENELF